MSSEHAPLSPRRSSQVRSNQSRTPRASSSSSSHSTLLYSGAWPHAGDLSNYLQNTFIPSVVPSPTEYEAKEAARLHLEKLAQEVSPGAKLLPFGSMANGFALKNSDMDLCCFLGADSPPRTPAELVETLGRLIEQETSFHVKMLPRARIPIIKLTMTPTGNAVGMACDIGFENRLALENTRLLLTYAMVDPRLRTLVLFLKVWTKRRKINNPYRGTLSSYGYVLLVIHYLVHVKNPPVLPNLQRLSSPRATVLEEVEFQGHDIRFFDDLETLPRIWQTANQDSVGQLLIDFFRYFSKDFSYNSDIISIRSEAGLISKDVKGWFTEVEHDPEVIVRDQHKLCIEDPFQLDYNVARTVTRDGLYTVRLETFDGVISPPLNPFLALQIRGEFMRAFRILSAKPERIPAMISELCEEREDFLVHHPPPPTSPRIPSQYWAPRRKSVPSPRPAPPPNSQARAVAMEDFRIWAALNGVNDVTGLGLASLDPRNFGRVSRSNGTPSNPPPTGLDEGWDYGVPGISTSTGYPCSTLPRRPPSHPSLNYARSQPASSPSSPPSIERRVSWDGGSGSSTGMPSSDYTNTNNDLHRFFQRRPGEYTIDPSNLSAPPSPDFSGRYYTGPGRSPYRQGGHVYSDGRHTLGPRMAASLPRGHHSSTSAAPTPIFPEPEIIAMANSITFGNFPSPHSHSYSRVSSNSSSTGGGGFSTFQSSPATSLNTFNLVEDDSERRGRGYPPTPFRSSGADDFDSVSSSTHPSSPSEFGDPRRGSAPHVQLGPDGRGSILFGEISVVLPVVLPAEAGPTEIVEGANLSSESLYPNGILNSTSLANAPYPALAVPIIPTLTTSPPTPIKERQPSAADGPTGLTPLAAFVPVSNHSTPPSLVNDTSIKPSSTSSALSNTRPKSNGWTKLPSSLPRLTSSPPPISPLLGAPCTTRPKPSPPNSPVISSTSNGLPPPPSTQTTTTPTPTPLSFAGAVRSPKLSGMAKLRLSNGADDVGIGREGKGREKLVEGTTAGAGDGGGGEGRRAKEARKR